MKNKLIFSENQLAYKLGASPEGASTSAEKVSSAICKKADKRYFNIIKKAGKLSASKFEKRLKKAVLPKEIKKAAIAEVNKSKFLYPTQQAFDAKVDKVSNKLLSLIKGEGIKISATSLNDLRGQAQGDIKRSAQKTAGFNVDNTSDTEATIGTAGLSKYKGIVSGMNGKVPKAKLLNVAKNYKTIAVAGIDSAITVNSRVTIANKIKKHMTAALNA